MKQKQWLQLQLLQKPVAKLYLFVNTSNNYSYVLSRVHDNWRIEFND